MVFGNGFFVASDCTKLGVLVVFSFLHLFLALFVFYAGLGYEMWIFSVGELFFFL